MEKEAGPNKEIEIEVLGTTSVNSRIGGYIGMAVMIWLALIIMITVTALLYKFVWVGLI